MRKYKIILAFFLSLPWTLGCAQSTTMPSAPTSVHAASMFDFWVGDWQASWTNSNGSKGHGRNRITKTLGGGAIEENFEESPESSPSPLLGKSLSVLEKASGSWRQTWVDNQGGFIVLRGSQEGDKRIFTTEMTERAGKLLVQRMVFHSITKDAFVWEWEGSTDGGKSWKRAWQIHYSK